MPSKQAGFKGVIHRDAHSGLRADVSPLFLTYFMMDWPELRQEPSKTRCLSCGGAMMHVEPLKSKKGVVFDGLVCHRCKTLLWARRKAA